MSCLSRLVTVPACDHCPRRRCSKSIKPKPGLNPWELNHLIALICLQNVLVPKIEIDKFDGKSDFVMWQRKTKTVLVQNKIVPTIYSPEEYLESWKGEILSEKLGSDEEVEHLKAQAQALRDYQLAKDRVRRVLKEHPRIGRYLKKGQYSGLIRTNNPVYMAAILEYLAAQELRQLLAGTTIAHGGLPAEELVVRKRNISPGPQKSDYISWWEELAILEERLIFSRCQNWPSFLYGCCYRVPCSRDNKKRIIPRHVLLAVRSGGKLHKPLAGVTISHGRVFLKT
ncbi:hypothetical protein M9H77_29759 [Catharanthus roseus]|uniref:Uncharacterized protein n=1 Tax=Catharanthus roseus TaxID=4058 RepID=A0ACB9ZVB6_CATRO|nr:hypothetical protein M9H77_29759 [Catharanthus roseus]